MPRAACGAVPFPQTLLESPADFGTRAPNFLKLG